ncbi:MAG: AIR synthase-related protein, partial [Candidatus Latescibacteria bacterium]|nr:AIR synthase-related protein [Candidatus Latescibacterota bacterium]
GRMAVAEAVTNIAAAGIGPIHHIKLSGNWMCACGQEGEDADLYDTVRAVGMEFCPALGVSIPVGKDSLSMRAQWEDSHGRSQQIVAPLSLVISAFAPVDDVRKVATPDLKRQSDTHLLLIDLGGGRNRMGGSVLAQVYNRLGDECPDADPQEVRRLYDAVQEMLDRDLILAYHDRSDGGLFTTVAEMAFGGRAGVRLDIAPLGP